MELASISVTPAKAKQFASKGIESVEDLLSYMPRKYKDYSRITGLGHDGDVVCIAAVVESIDVKNAGKTPYVRATCRESTSGEIVSVFWFHCQWMAAKLRSFVGKDVVIAGKISYNDQYHSYTITQPELFDFKSALGIYPVYRAIKGMSEEYLSEHMKAAISVGLHGSECLPEDILRRRNELTMPVALRYVHSPATMAEAARGTDRILLNDLVYFALHNELNKTAISNGSQYNVKTSALVNSIRRALPYNLTADQESVVSSIITNAKAGIRVNALVQGDVGCGKTLVCALAAAAFIGSGYQVVLMAPTQVLAQQHAETMQAMFEPHGVKTVYLHSALKSAARKAALAQISSGEAALIVGTHACLGKDVQYKNLALTVVDEEHKFGVKQRAAITGKAAAGVHNITMSATPIPRTLAQILYGDHIQLYTIKTMPNGRKPVMTGIAKDKMRVYRFLLRQVREGRQAYVVCPAIEMNDAAPNIASVAEISEEYRKYLEPNGVRIATLTGRDKASDAETTLAAFKRGEIDILVATTVIEVGVNVPNATVIVIENADRFGLSGLHQLRGRVGRGTEQSYCVLCSGDTTAEKSMERLNVLCTSNDGFRIAEEDLRLRGAGDLIGTRQAGDNKYVSLMIANPERYAHAREIAKEIIDRGMDCCTLAARVAAERETD